MKLPKRLAFPLLFHLLLGATLWTTLGTYHTRLLALFVVLYGVFAWLAFTPRTAGRALENASPLRRSRDQVRRSFSRPTAAPPRALSSAQTALSAQGSAGPAQLGSTMVAFLQDTGRYRRKSLCPFLLAWVLSSLLLSIDPRLIHATNGTALAVVHVLLLVQLAMAVILSVLLLRRRVPAAGVPVSVLATLAIILLLGCRILVPIASPSPFIDVFVNNTQAADALLAGVNPYSMSYPDIYHGTYDYPAVIPYWPGLLYSITLARSLTGDIRYLMVLSDAVTVVILLLLGRRRSSRGAFPSFLFPLLWLSFPPSLYVLEQAWVDPFLVPWVAIAAHALARSPLSRNGWLALSAALGFACSVKQYALLASALALVLVACTAGLKTALKGALVAFAVFLITVLPLALGEPARFSWMTIEVPLRLPLRPDGFTLGACVHRFFDAEIPAVISGALLAMVLAALLWNLVRGGAHSPESHLWRWGAACVLAYGALFLLAPQAFCNYYLFLDFFLVVLWFANTTTPRDQKISV
ncbi:MAG: hypothetical protein AB1486_26170 [Planctomycetota bacterium]